jgi:hypothetical protein
VRSKARFAHEEAAMEPLPEPSTPPQTANDPGLHCPQCGYNLTGLSEDRCPQCGLPSAGVPAARENRELEFRGTKRVCLFIIAAIFIAVGVADAVVSLPRHVEFLIELLVAVSTLFWCRSDAIVHGYRLGTGTQVLVFLLPPLGLLIYLIAHKRWKSLMKAAGFIVGLLIAAAILSVVTFRVYHGYWADELQE